MKVDWKPIGNCPREVKAAWLYSSLDGVFTGVKGIGGEWWNSRGFRPYAVTHYAEYVLPDPPEGT